MEDRYSTFRKSKSRVCVSIVRGGKKVTPPEKGVRTILRGQAPNGQRGRAAGAQSQVSLHCEVLMAEDAICAKVRIKRKSK